MNRREFLVNGTIAAGSALMLGRLALWAAPSHAAVPTHFPITHTDAEWRKLLTPEQYWIMRQYGTEPAYSGKYNDFWGKGHYVCPADGNILFSSATKYNAHEGWPSFWQLYKQNAVVTFPDHSMGMDRTQVSCAQCGSHLGHLFHDGPPPTGLRYCMDSLALKFVPTGTKA